MISLSDYVGPHSHSADWNDTRRANAEALLPPVNDLLAQAVADGVKLHTNPATGSYVSGQTMGGFRPQSCTQGAPGSSHKQGMAVDIYDPLHKLAPWCLANLDVLEALGLYMEHPDATSTWCHLTTRAPHSGRRAFFP
jgi:hypothetical protein